MGVEAGGWKNAYELLNLGAPKYLLLNTLHIFQDILCGISKDTKG